MRLHRAFADVFIPDGVVESQALQRVTHMAVGAHQDDLEIMAYQGIAECLDDPKRWFCGVVCTNGGGSPRTGPYGNYSDEEMQLIRREEQRNAARIGKYGIVFQLDYPSAEIKDPRKHHLLEDLVAILEATRPKIVYTHSPTDKHETHVAVFATLLKALRQIPAEQRPERFWGCEIWRGLDWLQDEEKIAMDVSSRGNVRGALLGVFDSQIAGGKRYDLAAIGRSKANATFFQSHGVDEAQELWYGMDLSPLIQNDECAPEDFVIGFIDRFRDDVRSRIKRYFS